MRTLLLRSIAVIGLLLFGVFLNIGVYAQSPKKSTYLDTVTFIQYLDDNVALQENKIGHLNNYFFRIPLETVSCVKADPNLKVYERIAGSFGVLMKPAPSK